MADLERLVIQPKRWRPTLLGLAVILPPPLAYWFLTIFRDEWSFDSRSLIILIPVGILAIWQLAKAWLRKPMVLTPQGLSLDGGDSFTPWNEIDFFVPGAGTWKIKGANEAHRWLSPDEWRLPRSRLMSTLDEWHATHG